MLGPTAPSLLTYGDAIREIYLSLAEQEECATIKEADDDNDDVFFGPITTEEYKVTLKSIARSCRAAVQSKFHKAAALSLRQGEPQPKMANTFYGQLPVLTPLYQSKLPFCCAPDLAEQQATAEQDVLETERYVEEARDLKAREASTQQAAVQQTVSQPQLSRLRRPTPAVCIDRWAGTSVKALVF